MRWNSRPQGLKPPLLTLPMHVSDSEEDDYLCAEELHVLVDKTVGPCEHLRDCDPEECLIDYTHHTSRRNTSSHVRPWHKQARYAGLLRSTMVSVSVLLLVAAFSGYWIVQLLLIRHSAYMHSVTALPILPDGRYIEHLVHPFETGVTPEFENNAAVNLQGRSTHLQRVQAELDRRFVTINAPVSTMTCDWTVNAQDRYKALPSQGPYLFAMNLYNNQQVIPTLAKTLLQLAEYLGPDNILVSVFENGSSDNTTFALAHLAAALSAANVAHEVLSDPRKTDWRYVDRIAQLALYRNFVLRPVNSTLPPRGSLDNDEADHQPARRPFEHVIFINDVFLCPTDVLELVHQRTSQHAHAACAMDWRKTKPWFGKLFGSRTNVKFYDNWVSRTLSGNLFRARVDLLAEYRDGVSELVDQISDEPTRYRLQHGLPMPVYSCWNGVIALPAAPFRGAVQGHENPGVSDSEAKSSTRRANTLEAVTFRSTLNTAETCPGASECKIMASDFWSRGLNRWLVIPTVHVSYEREIYDHPALRKLAHKGRIAANASAPSSPGITERVDWTILKPPDTVACYPWFRGTKIELQEIRAPPF